MIPSGHVIPRRRLTVVLGAALASAVVTAPAQAVVLRAAQGRFISAAPRRPAPGGAISAARAATPVRSQTIAAAGALSWHGGPVVHSSAPYLLFWTPPGQSIPAATASLLERFFNDVAAGSGRANVYAIDRQYTDSSGFADYSQTFSPTSQALSDSARYPARDAGNCPDVAASDPICITDTQIQAELSREIAAARLPTDGSAKAYSLPRKAPIYFVVLPSDVSVCFSDGEVACATTDFCAYHSSFVDGRGNNVLYATIPTWAVRAGGHPKDCQADATTAVQEPNRTPADVVLKYLNHENVETLTDPTGSGWWNNASGNEEADNCNAFGPANPADGTSPNAFGPLLGGSAAAGTLFDQVIGHSYYLQSEWSNGDGTCELKPSGATLTPSFTVPGTPGVAGTAISFNPAASRAGTGLSSATWNFGDGSAAFKGPGHARGTVAHAYATAGTYTVTLRLVDGRGDLATASRRVRVNARATAARTRAPK